jgi:hypothetical protein
MQSLAFNATDLVPLTGCRGFSLDPMGNDIAIFPGEEIGAGVESNVKTVDISDFVPDYESLVENGWVFRM